MESVNASAMVKFNRWTEAEDSLLLNLIGKLKNRWKQVSRILKTKTAKQSFSRYQRINPAYKEGKWTKKEDIKLKEFVQQYNKDWSLISKVFISRSPKQVRDRFVNYLNPDLVKRDFTKEEDLIIFNCVKKLGKKWVLISKQLNGRSSYSIRNRYNMMIGRVQQQYFIADTIATTLSSSTSKVFKITKMMKRILHNRKTFVNSFSDITKKADNMLITDAHEDYLVFEDDDKLPIKDNLYWCTHML